MNLLRKYLRALQKCWQFFAYIRNSPETIGPSLTHKVVITLVYIGCFCWALYMIFSILTHQTVFKNIVEQGDNSTVQYPSALLCPEKSKIYQYSFIANKTAISSLGLGVKAIDILARAAMENLLDAPSVAAELAPHINATKMHPEQMWKSIINWVYYRPTFYNDKNVIVDSGGYRKDADIDCYKFHKSNFIDCSQTQGIWLTDDSYCFLWNNTNRNYTYTYSSYSTTRIIMHNKNNSAYKVWIGNLLTDPIVFETGTRLEYFLSIYKIPKQTRAICQPLIEKSCKETDTVYDQWKFIIAKRIGKQVKMEDAIDIYIYLPTSWFDIQSVSRYSIGKGVEMAGSVLGIWVGLSILAFLKVVLIFIKRWATLTAKVMVSVQFMAVLCLLVGAAILESLNYVYLQQRRYISQVNIDTYNGVPYPSIHFCFRGMTGYNQTEVERLNISLPLLTYMQVTSTFVPHHFYIPSVKPDFFVYHNKTPAEVGYHWSFMEFPLQYISHDLYEKYMTKVEKEYAALAATLGINASKPSFNVLSKLMIDPCKAMKTCYIDGKQNKSCCRYIKPVIHTYRQGYPLCWMFDNSNGELKQTQSGSEHGVKFVFDVHELKRGMEQIWLDDYLKKFAKKCSALYKCETEIHNKLAWNPYSAISIRVNEYFSMQQIYFVHMHTAWDNYMLVQADIGLKATKTSHLSYKPGRKCSNHRPVSDLFFYTQQEILYKKCGCYICSDPPVYHTQIAACCTPKEAGRCLTSLDMYSVDCKYGKFAGNLPPEAPGNIMLSSSYTSHHCKNFTLPEFNKLLQTIEEKESNFKKQPCKSFLVQQTTIGKLETMDNSHILNFHYETVNFLEFMEKDLQNFWELFGLFTGLLSLCFGISYVTTAGAVIIGMIKIYSFIAGKTNSSDGVAALAVYGLSKFNKRLEYLINSKHNHTPAKVARNVVNVAPVIVNHENSVAGVHHDVNPGEPEVNEIQETHQNQLPEEPIEETNSGRDSLKFFILITGICFLIVFCLQLQKSMEIDKNIHQFSIEETGVVPPNIGICTNVQKNGPNKIINFFEKCSVHGTDVGCKKLFLMFLGSKRFDCLVGIYNASDFENAQSGKNGLEIEFIKGHQPLYIWLGDVKTINSAEIFPQYTISTKELIFLSYQQWEIRESTDCEKKLTVSCPKCSSQLREGDSVVFCCTESTFVEFNPTSRLKRHCKISSYEIKETHLETMTERQMNHFTNTSILSISSVENSKYLISNEQQRTYSEMFMLYSGYIGLFIGVNIDNVICAILSLPKKFFT